MSLYEIAFSGQLLPGAKLEQVEANLTRLFQADAQRIALLFSGRRIVIKQNLDFAAVEKYRQAMERAGAQGRGQTDAGGCRGNRAGAATTRHACRYPCEYRTCNGSARRDTWRTEGDAAG